jgi:hypothetical protein
MDNGLQRRKVDTCQKLRTVHHHDFNDHFEVLRTDQICLFVKASLYAYKSDVAQAQPWSAAATYP